MCVCACVRVCVIGCGLAFDLERGQCNNAELTPIHLAARFNRLGVLDLLINSKADVNVVDYQKITPLYVCCCHRVVLLDRDASPQVL